MSKQIAEPINEELMLDLFSFDFSKVNLLTDERIQIALAEVIAQAKLTGNYDSFHVVGSNKRAMLSMNTTNLLPDLQRMGYLHIWDNGRMCHLNNEYKDWHNPSDIAERYRGLCLDAIARGKNHYDLYSIHLWCVGPGIIEAVDVVNQEISEHLGIKHAKQSPAALGMKIGFLNKNNKSALHAIHEVTKNLSHWKDIYQYFKTIAIEQPDSYSKGDMEYVILSPSVYHCVCLAQSKDYQDVAIIVPYMGGSWVDLDKMDRKIVPYEGNESLEIEEENADDLNIFEDEEDEET
jgi:hypothetical protein